MNSRIRIKMGNVEIEFEGSEEFLKAELMDIVSAVATLHGTETVADEEGEPGSARDQRRVSEDEALADVGTTGTIAARIGADSGPELALAAAAHLTFAQNMETFKRRELLIEMQAAKSYYKQSYSGNLSKMLTRLVKDDKLRETARETYALSAATRAMLQRQLAR